MKSGKKNQARLASRTLRICHVHQRGSQRLGAAKTAEENNPVVSDGIL